jgi:hypothetical protein
MLADDTSLVSQRDSTSHSIDCCRIIAIYVRFGDLKMFCTLIPAFEDLCVEFVNVEVLSPLQLAAQAALGQQHK